VCESSPDPIRLKEAYVEALPLMCALFAEGRCTQYLGAILLVREPPRGVYVEPFTLRECESLYDTNDATKVGETVWVTC